MGIGQIIAIASGFIVILTAILGGFTWILSRMTSKAFTDGEHEKEHMSLGVDVKAAHDKIREHDSKISDLENNHGNLTTKVDMMLDNQKAMLSRLNQIYKVAQ